MKQRVLVFDSKGKLVDKPKEKKTKKLVPIIKGTTGTQKK